jgi:uncharacterized membrane protein
MLGVTLVKLRTIEIVTIGMCGALYAGFGYLTYLGLFTPVIGVVRFWPAVIVPAVFATLFGPLVGGLGAAIGIFISDMLIHGDALLSIIVGVPSNFLMFYIIGLLARKKLSKNVSQTGILLGIASVISTLLLLVFSPNYLGEPTSQLFVGISVVCTIIFFVIFQLYPNWRSYEVASIIGLGVGALWIGVGVWVFSKFFTIVTTGETNISLYAALGWFIWTYFTEIPFLLLVVPPILKACYLAFPSLKPQETVSTPQVPEND